MARVAQFEMRINLPAGRSCRQGSRSWILMGKPHDQRNGSHRLKPLQTGNPLLSSFLRRETKFNCGEVMSTQFRCTKIDHFCSRRQVTAGASLTRKKRGSSTGRMRLICDQPQNYVILLLMSVQMQIFPSSVDRGPHIEVRTRVLRLINIFSTVASRPVFLRIYLRALTTTDHRKFRLQRCLLLNLDPVSSHGTPGELFPSYFIIHERR